MDTVTITIPFQFEVPADSPLLSEHGGTMQVALVDLESAAEDAIAELHPHAHTKAIAIMPYRGSHYHTIVLNPDGSRANKVHPE